MLNNNETNITYSKEQSQAIEGVKTTLLNLESEVSIAQKNLRAIKSETERVTKEKIYQEECLNDVSIKVEIAKNSLDEMSQTLQDKNSELAHLNSEIVTKSTSLNSKENELKEREELVSKNENYLIEKDGQITVRENELKLNIEEFNLKVEKVKEVISEF